MNNNCLQQLGFRCGCKPNNENRVELFLKSGQANDYKSGNTIELSKSFEKEQQEDLESSFFWSEFRMVFIRLVLSGSDLG